jgi:hypothetical protein
MRGRKNNENKVMTKFEDLIENKIQVFKNTILFPKNRNSSLSLPVKWGCV